MLRRGFTLIELLVVISIIGILASVLLLNFRQIQERARNAKAKSDIATLVTALAVASQLDEANRYPSGPECASGVTTDCFLRITQELHRKEILPVPVVKSPSPRHIYAASTNSPTDATSYCLQTTLEVRLGEPAYFIGKNGATELSNRGC